MSVQAIGEAYIYHRQDSHSDSAWQNGKAFSSQEIWNRLEKSGKVRKNHTKYWKTEGISDLLFAIVSEKNKTFRKYWEMEGGGILEKSG